MVCVLSSLPWRAVANMERWCCCVRWGILLRMQLQRMSQCKMDRIGRILWDPPRRSASRFTIHFAFIPMQLLSLPLDAVEVYVHVYEVTIRHPALVCTLQ